MSTITKSDSDLSFAGKHVDSPWTYVTLAFLFIASYFGLANMMHDGKSDTTLNSFNKKVFSKLDPEVKKSIVDDIKQLISDNKEWLKKNNYEDLIKLLGDKNQQPVVSQKIMSSFIEAFTKCYGKQGLKKILPQSLSKLIIEFHKYQESQKGKPKDPSLKERSDNQKSLHGK